MTIVVINEPREVHDFKAVSLKGYGDLLLKQGSEEGLVVEAEEAVLPYIITEVVDGRLVIEYKSPLSIPFAMRPIVYNLSFKELDWVEISGSGTVEAESLHARDFKIEISGSGSVQIDDLTAQRLAIDVSGSAKVEVTGSVPEQDIQISGSAKVQAWGLSSERVKVRVSGSGDVTVRPARLLDVDISGVGTVEYFGEPQIRRKITGIGSLQPLGD